MRSAISGRSRHMASKRVAVELEHACVASRPRRARSGAAAPGRPISPKKSPGPWRATVRVAVRRRRAAARPARLDARRGRSARRRRRRSPRPARTRARSSGGRRSPCPRGGVAARSPRPSTDATVRPPAGAALARRGELPLGRSLDGVLEVVGLHHADVGRRDGPVRAQHVEASGSRSPRSAGPAPRRRGGPGSGSCARRRRAPPPRGRPRRPRPRPPRPGPVAVVELVQDRDLELARRCTRWPRSRARPACRAASASATGSPSQVRERPSRGAGCAPRLARAPPTRQPSRPRRSSDGGQRARRARRFTGAPSPPAVTTSERNTK